jgi:STE24 endopeptidase
MLLGWLASGVAMLSRSGERIAVWVGAGFRRPTKPQAAVLAPAWSSALSRCGLSSADFDLYTLRCRSPNAFAAGGRSVAITTGMLATFQAHRRVEEYLAAVLTHDLLTAPVTTMSEMPAA